MNHPAPNRLAMNRPALRRLSIALACSSALASPLAAQRGAAAVPTHALTRADARHAEPFTTVAGVRELADGRLVVVDRGEKSIQLLDLAAGSAVRVGHEGGGPNEYRQPNSAFPLPGDSTLVFDIGSMRYVVVAPNGTVARTFSTMDPESGSMRLLLARGTDGAGNLYFLDRGLSAGPGAVPVARDSGTVLRYDPRTKAVASVATVALPETKINASGSAGQRQVMVRSTPFAAQDDWTPGLDGRIAIVRHEPYRVEWLAPSGQRVTGPAVAYEPLRVTEKDREAWRERSRNPAGGVRIVVGGPPGAGSAPAPMVTNARMAEPDDWPERKPPFPAGAAIVATDGRLWVQRSTPAGDDVPRYDIFDSFGRLVARATLPSASRLVGFGRNSAYVVQKDENDLEYLERYRLP